MNAPVQIVLTTTLAFFVLSLISIHFLRSWVSARFLSEDQFRDFKENGIMGQSSILEPSRMKWEYRFVISSLAIDPDPKARLVSLAWQWSWKLFLLSGIAFGVTSIVSAIT
jgi:hypothetical protein